MSKNIKVPSWLLDEQSTPARKQAQEQVPMYMRLVAGLGALAILVSLSIFVVRFIGGKQDPRIQPIVENQVIFDIEDNAILDIQENYTVISVTKDQYIRYIILDDQNNPVFPRTLDANRQETEKEK